MLCSLHSQQPYRTLAIEKSAVLRPETERLICRWKALGLPVFDNRKQPDGDMEKALLSPLTSTISLFRRKITTYQQNPSVPKSHNIDLFQPKSRKKEKLESIMAFGNISCVGVRHCDVLK